MDPIDPVLLTLEARLALAARDIATVYQLLKDAGVSQRRIAELTGQSQSQVHDILHGRTVKQYDVIVRIADGLGVDRAWLGVSHGPDGAYAEPVTRAEPPEGMTAEMKRRAFLAAVSTAMWGSPVLGKAIDLPAPHGAPGHLPGTLRMTDVTAVENMTGHFRALARQYGGHAEIVSAAATRSARLAMVSATEPVRQRLRSTLADLHTLAGWCCYDERDDDHARWHYRQAVELAPSADQVATTLRYAGVMERANGAPNHALKLHQLGRAQLGETGDPRLVAWGHAVSAMALADMGHRDQARSALAAAREVWEPPNPSERADMDYQCALVIDHLGQTDTAEQLAAGVNGVGRQRPVGVLASVLRARLHIQNGEPRGLALAKTAIDGVAGLHSLRARDRLLPLVDALVARPGSDVQELARHARRVATAAA